MFIHNMMKKSKEAALIRAEHHWSTALLQTTKHCIYIIPLAWSIGKQVNNGKCSSWECFWCELKSEVVKQSSQVAQRACKCTQYLYNLTLTFPNIYPSSFQFSLTKLIYQINVSVRSMLSWCWMLVPLCKFSCTLL